MKRKRKANYGMQSKSGFIGVQANPRQKKGTRLYQALILINRKKKYIGSFYTAEEAAKAYDDEAIKLRRPVSSLNYPAPVGYTPKQLTLRSHNTVGYRGVSLSGKKYLVQLTVGKKCIHGGMHDTAIEAAIAYDREVLKANQCTSLLNFPDLIHNLDVEPKRSDLRQHVHNLGYRGVSKKGTRFQSRIIYEVNHAPGWKLEELGEFETAIQAALAYDQAALEQGNKRSTLNFPDGLPITMFKDENAFLLAILNIVFSDSEEDRFRV